MPLIFACLRVIYVTDKTGKAAFVMDKEMEKDIDEFIVSRINYHSSNESEGLEDAYLSFSDAVQKLRDTLTPEQEFLFRKCENSYGVLEGETINFYYQSGFSDAVNFFKRWLR